MIAAAGAALLWRGDRLMPLLLAFAALQHPGVSLAVITIWVVVSRLRSGGQTTPDEEALLLDRLVGELEGGTSPRAALLAIGRRGGVIRLDATTRMVSAGLPAQTIARSLREALPFNGRLTAAAWALAGDMGAPAAPVMGLLARRAAERGRLDRERRALTAQARATAWLIAGLPLAVLVGLAVTGRISPGPTLSVVLVGCALQVAGLAIVVLMMRRAG